MRPKIINKAPQIVGSHQRLVAGHDQEVISDRFVKSCQEATDRP
jgi:hypothetical protein